MNGTENAARQCADMWPATPSTFKLLLLKVHGVQFNTSLELYNHMKFFLLGIVTKKHFYIQNLFDKLL